MQRVFDKPRTLAAELPADVEPLRRLFHAAMAVFADEVAVKADLEQLNARVGADGQSAGSYSLALHRLLEAAEREMGLAAAVFVADLLPPQRFVELLAKGVPMIDVGADAVNDSRRHGAFSHRIQWYLIAQAWKRQNAAADFASIAALYGASGTAIGGPAENVITVWKVLFDVEGPDTDLSIPETFKDLYGLWRFDWLDRAEIELGPLRRGNRLPGTEPPWVTAMMAAQREQERQAKAQASAAASAAARPAPAMSQPSPAGAGAAAVTGPATAPISAEGQALLDVFGTEDD